MITPIHAVAVHFSERRSPDLARWLTRRDGLKARREQLEAMKDQLGRLLGKFPSSDDALYQSLFDAYGCLILALQSQPISRDLCLKALRKIQSAADTAALGVAAG